MTFLRFNQIALKQSHTYLFGLLFLSAVFFSAGCGGGGSSSTVIPPTVKSPNTVHGCAIAFVTTVSGRATNLAGAPIIGATVSVGNQSALTTQFGTYSIPNIAVAPSQRSVILAVSAAISIQGVNWTGRNTLEISGCDTNTSNVNLVMSPTTTQASISGTVVDSKGPLAFARVFAGDQDSLALAYQNPRSFWAITDINGRYTISALPMTSVGASSSYTVTASKDLYVNRVTAVAVSSGQQSAADFTLTAATTGPCSDSVPCAPVTNFSVISITTPTNPTRSASGVASAGNVLVKQFIFQHRGLHTVHASRSIQRIAHASNSRNAPIGSNVESDLFWDADVTSGLLGYDVLRSDLVSTNFKPIAVLRDPQADHFTDIDSALTPGSIYYYSVTKLDTFHFPTNSEEGQPIQNSNSVVVPLLAQTLLAPADKSTISGSLTFSWPSIIDGSIYQVLVYDRFPDLQSSSDPAGVKPTWPISSSDSTSEVHSPAGTQPQSYSLRYGGPALISAHVYYWAVLTSDSGGGAYSISQIYSFTAP